jgi:hypothetical protein
MSTARKPIWRSRWWLPAVSVSLGLMMLAAFWIGGNRDDGLLGLLVMVALGAVFLVFGGRSETIGGLGGPGRDERWEMIDLRATSATGMVLIACILGAWLYELSQGRDGEPYSQLGAVGGVAYVLALAFLRWRG